jgi:hypothetical protein
MLTGIQRVLFEDKIGGLYGCSILFIFILLKDLSEQSCILWR